MRRADFEWIIPAGHPAFAGHFPGRPIVPGVVLLDRALFFAEAFLGRAATAWHIAQAKFFSPVGPGEKLVYRLQERVHERAGEFVVFSVRAGEREVAAGSLNPAR